MTKLSFQIYSAREYQPWEAVFEKLGNAGYTAIEGFGGVYGAMDKAAATSLKESLSAHGLDIPTGHFSIDDLENRIEAVLDFASVLEMQDIYCPYLMPDQRPTDYTGWKAFGERLEKAGEAVKAAGYGFGWHNHDFEFQTFEGGRTALDGIFEGAPTLCWEADMAWVVRGGADPLAMIETYGNRITSVHVKDVAPEGEKTDEGGWADPGKGVLPWPEIMKAIRERTGARHFIVEHDNPNDIDRLINNAISAFKSW